MTLVKGSRNLKFTIEDTKPEIPKKQVIIFGAFISALSISFAMGYILYVTNPLAQEYFIKLTSIGF
tara:strand:- start:32 stop:229 length:198 start_codon:yes stop_codon:yes gene_type:complete